MIILTNDPSFTAWGWGVVQVTKNKISILDVGCIKTQPEYKKKRIRKSDDRVRRAEEISALLLNIIKRYKVNWIVSELPHGSQSASAAVMLGITAGILTGLGKALGIPVEWWSEGDAKKAIAHRRSVSKQVMVDSIDKIYHPPFTKIEYIDEAIADALAIFHVARDQSMVIQAALKGIQ